MTREQLAQSWGSMLDGLEAWILDESTATWSAFEALVAQHVRERHSQGVHPRSITRELAALRRALVSEAAPDARARIDVAIDAAIDVTLQHFTELRDRVRDRFVAILAHDLRSPLSSITMASDRIQLTSMKAGDELTRETSAAIGRSAERMDRMISDLLDFARGYLALGIPVVLADLDLGALVREVVGELVIAQPARRVAVALAGDLRGRFDADRVHQALSNLLTYALVHGADPIQVDLRESDDHAALDLAVTCHGRVLPADELSTLFDPFREPPPERRESLGLGLFIMHEVALAHGATCAAASTAGAGTTITIRWPRARAA